MLDRIRELRIACLPFVTRALRGTRRRRFTLGAGLLALLVALFGLWVGQSSTDAARDVRVSLRLERPVWEREHAEFILIFDRERDRDRAIRQFEKAAPSVQHWNPLRYRAEEAWVLLDTVVGPHVVPPRNLQSLQQRARELRNARADLAPADLEERRRHQHFDWNDPDEIRRLRSIVDSRLVPRVEVYRSPIDLAGTVKLVGLFAGWLVLVLGLVVAPLSVGVQMAQELHENTLQPLTGTALTARQLVVGLVAGALAPVAMVAAPLIVLHLGCAALAGRVVPAIGFELSTLAMAAMLTGLAMLGALSQGRHRAPGLIGIALLALLGLSGLFGVGLGLHLHHRTVGAVTVIPSAGPTHLLTEAFFPMNHLGPNGATSLDLRLVLTTVGALILAWIIGRAIGRRVGGTSRDGAITQVEALVAAFVLVLLAVAALPDHRHPGETFLPALALVLLPLQLVLAGRVPDTDVPPSLRRIPLGTLVREHALWVAMVLVVSLVIADLPQWRGGVIVSAVHLVWAVVVASLITIRGTSMPPRSRASCGC